MEKDKELILDDLFNEERKAEFFEWREKNPDRIEEYKKIPAGSAPLMMAIMDFKYDFLWRFATDIQNTLDDLLNFIEEEVPEEINRQKLAPLLIHYDEIKAKQKRDVAFDIGRQKGRKIRKEKAEKNREKLATAINDLFEKDSSPGWKWSNSEIAKFVHEKFPVYAITTTEQRVKTLAAKQRKKYKL